MGVRVRGKATARPKEVEDPGLQCWVEEHVCRKPEMPGVSLTCISRAKPDETVAFRPAAFHRLEPPPGPIAVLPGIQADASNSAAWSNGGLGGCRRLRPWPAGVPQMLHFATRAAFCSARRAAWPRGTRADRHASPV